MTKALMPADEVPPQESTISVDGSEGVTQLEKVQALRAIDTTTKVSTDEASTRQNTTNS